MPKQNENLQLGCFEIDCADNELTARIVGLYNPKYDWNGWKSPYAWYSDIQTFCDAMGWQAELTDYARSIIVTFPDGTSTYFPKEYVHAYGGMRGMYNLEGLVWRVVS